MGPITLYRGKHVMGRKLQLILFASIGLNLIFIGVFIGYGFKGCGKGRHPKGPPPELMAQISPEQQKRVGKLLREMHREGREERREIRKERRKSLEILTAPTFDAEAYRKVMAGLHELQGAKKNQMTETIIELASTLDQSDRQALAAFLARGPKGRDRDRGPGRNWGPRGPRGPGMERPRGIHRGFRRAPPSGELPDQPLPDGIESDSNP